MVCLFTLFQLLLKIKPISNTAVRKQKIQIQSLIVKIHIKGVTTFKLASVTKYTSTYE